MTNAMKNAQALVMENMEDILVVRVLRLAMENARFGRSVLTMVPVVLILIVSATTIQSCGFFLSSDILYIIFFIDDDSNKIQSRLVPSLPCERLDRCESPPQHHLQPTTTTTTTTNRLLIALWDEKDFC